MLLFLLCKNKVTFIIDLQNVNEVFNFTKCIFNKI